MMLSPGSAPSCSTSSFRSRLSRSWSSPYGNCATARELCRSPSVSEHAVRADATEAAGHFCVRCTVAPQTECGPKEMHHKSRNRQCRSALGAHGDPPFPAVERPVNGPRQPYAITWSTSGQLRTPNHATLESAGRCSRAGAILGERGARRHSRAPEHGAREVARDELSWCGNRTARKKACEAQTSTSSSLP